MTPVEQVPEMNLPKVRFTGRTRKVAFPVTSDPGCARHSFVCFVARSVGMAYSCRLGGRTRFPFIRPGSSAPGALKRHGKVVCHCSICGNDLAATTGSHGQFPRLYRIAKLIPLPEREAQVAPRLRCL